MQCKFIIRFPQALEKLEKREDFSVRETSGNFDILPESQENFWSVRVQSEKIKTENNFKNSHEKYKYGCI